MPTSSGSTSPSVRLLSVPCVCVLRWRRLHHHPHGPLTLQPIVSSSTTGVGFSYGDKQDYIDDEEGVGEDLYQFLQVKLLTRYDAPCPFVYSYVYVYGWTQPPCVSTHPPQAFFKGNPDLQGRPFYIFGESYGPCIPSCMHACMMMAGSRPSIHPPTRTQPTTQAGTTPPRPATACLWATRTSRLGTCPSTSRASGSGTG